MTNVPNLYLKWAAFRTLVKPAQPDVQIAKALFADQFGVRGAKGNRPILFSRMLRGEYSLQPEIAGKLATRMNASIEVYRGDHNLGGSSDKRLSANDLYSPLNEFTRRLIEAVADRNVLNEVQQKFFSEELTRTQQELLDILAPKGPEGNPAKLLVQRVATDRFIGDPKPSGGQGPVIFDPGSDMGQLSIEGLSEAPIAAYTFFARDPGPERWFWDLNWGDTVRWLDSPFKPIPAGGRFNLFPTPQKIESIGGRFLVTTAIVLDKGALAELDPRGADAAPGALNENQTAMFLTEARRLANPKGKGKRPRVMLATSEYRVVG
jgi:hypothetical protein